MLIIDIVLAVALLGFTARGWKNGLIESFGELLGAILAFLAARAWSPMFGRIIGAILPGREGLARFIAFVIVFLIIARFIGWLFTLTAKLLRIVTSLPIISLFNRILGACFGFLGGIVFVGSSVYLVLTFHLDAMLVSWLGSSSIALWSERAFSGLLRFLL
ncbi:hypothetical protein COX00_01045 [Candidatus Uhrbacteria bacterium CG22_combo_CG10-13_8_21_14_all_47_17]|uniref:Colicin V production protein n=1 Tax=Candidatus Uhrbacteria bacterium CG22_combo_CG10-13_8_21_14_all_47_17 TaxID=1975041 RepID=A0A2H0BT50_9BACT|nr:MAG: hypothetical protein COX00_01045 [Candidatus Uhrbacteria bacterium CG22_combo_CG10-13_8_21_14_all_47_17]